MLRATDAIAPEHEFSVVHVPEVGKLDITDNQGRAVGGAERLDPAELDRAADVLARIYIERGSGNFSAAAAEGIDHAVLALG